MEVEHACLEEPVITISPPKKSHFEPPRVDGGHSAELLYGGNPALASFEQSTRSPSHATRQNPLQMSYSIGRFHTTAAKVLAFRRMNRAAQVQSSVDFAVHALLGYDDPSPNPGASLQTPPVRFRMSRSPSLFERANAPAFAGASPTVPAPPSDQVAEPPVSHSPIIPEAGGQFPMRSSGLPSTSDSGLFATFSRAPAAARSSNTLAPPPSRQAQPRLSVTSSGALAAASLAVPTGPAARPVPQPQLTVAPLLVSASVATPHSFAATVTLAQQHHIQQQQQLLNAALAQSTRGKTAAAAAIAKHSNSTVEQRLTSLADALAEHESTITSPMTDPADAWAIVRDTVACVRALAAVSEALVAPRAAAPPLAQRGGDADGPLGGTVGGGGWAAADRVAGGMLAGSMSVSMAAGAMRARKPRDPTVRRSIVFDRTADRGGGLSPAGRPMDGRERGGMGASLSLRAGSLAVAERLERRAAGGGGAMSAAAGGDGVDVGASLVSSPHLRVPIGGFRSRHAQQHGLPPAASGGPGGSPPDGGRGAVADSTDRVGWDAAADALGPAAARPILCSSEDSVVGASFAAAQHTAHGAGGGDDAWPLGGAPGYSRRRSGHPSGTPPRAPGFAPGFHGGPGGGESSLPLPDGLMSPSPPSAGHPASVGGSRGESGPGSLVMAPSVVEEVSPPLAGARRISGLARRLSNASSAHAPIGGDPPRFVLPDVLSAQASDDDSVCAGLPLRTAQSPAGSHKESSPISHAAVGAGAAAGTAASTTAAAAADVTGSIDGTFVGLSSHATVSPAAPTRSAAPAPATAPMPQTFPPARAAPLSWDDFSPPTASAGGPAAGGSAGGSSGQRGGSGGLGGGGAQLACPVGSVESGADGGAALALSLGAPPPPSTARLVDLPAGAGAGADRSLTVGAWPHARGGVPAIITTTPTVIPDHTGSWHDGGDGFTPSTHVPVAPQRGAGALPRPAQPHSLPAPVRVVPPEECPAAPPSRAAPSAARAHPPLRPQRPSSIGSVSTASTADLPTHHWGARMSPLLARHGASALPRTPQLVARAAGHRGSPDSTPGSDAPSVADSCIVDTPGDIHRLAPRIAVPPPRAAQHHQQGLAPSPIVSPSPVGGPLVRMGTQQSLSAFVFPARPAGAAGVLSPHESPAGSYESSDRDAPVAGPEPGRWLSPPQIVTGTPPNPDAALLLRATAAATDRLQVRSSGGLSLRGRVSTGDDDGGSSEDAYQGGRYRDFQAWI